MYLEHFKQTGLKKLTADDYQQKALRTKAHMSEKECLLDCSLGLAGESSEVLELATKLSILTGNIADETKKCIFHQHSLDIDKLIKELGDLSWYIAVLADCFGYKLSEVLETNVLKLQERYPEGFDPERSKNRGEEKTNKQQSEGSSRGVGVSPQVDGARIPVPERTAVQR